MPATSVISIPESPSSAQPSRSASSPSFIGFSQTSGVQFTSVWGNAGQRAGTRKAELFFEELRLRGRHSSRTSQPLRRAHHSQHFHLSQGRARHINARAIAVQIRRNELDAAIQNLQQLVHNDAFQGIAVAKGQPQPQAFQFWTAQEGFALREVSLIEVIHEVNRLNLVGGYSLMLAISRQQINSVGTRQFRRIHIAFMRGQVQQEYYGLLSSGRARAGLHFRLSSAGWLRNSRGYVIFIGTYCQVVGDKRVSNGEPRD